MNNPATPQGRSEKDIFFEALQKPTPEERAAFIDGACGTNPVQRARVEALLANHLQQSEFMKSPAVGALTATVPVPPTEFPAQIIGRYKLLEKIGEGGFGDVWMAEQREPVKRRVALKILKLGMESRQIVARFEAERQALAMMDHPNIARIHDAGTTDNGRPYFVMELVRGVKITEYCDQNQLPTKQRLDLFITVCQAIQHAHQKGIIHRDIKPSNILVTVNDGVAVAKVIDFGIAKATQQELTDKTVFTQFQQFIGTPAYISPEQAEMSSLDIDTRADIYSLGVLLYELLVGQTPFDAGEMMKGGLDALRKIIREREPQRPSTRLNTLPGDARTTAGKRRQTDAVKLVHQLQGDLDWIVMKCLEKDRTRRYETANGLAADLKRHLANEPVTARPPSLGYRVQKTLRRHRAAFATAAIVVVALLVGLGVAVQQAIQKSRALDLMTEAELAQARSREAAEKALAGEAEARHRVDELLKREQLELLQAGKRIYAMDIHFAQRAVNEKNPEGARKLLARHYPKPGQTNRPGWEWRHLWQQTRTEATAEVCRVTGINGPAVSADGRVLAAVRQDSGRSLIELIDITDVRNPVKGGTILGQTSNSISTIAFSPGNGLIAHEEGASENHAAGPRPARIIAIHDVRTLQRVGTITNLIDRSHAISLVWSADGRNILSHRISDEGLRIDVWRLSDLKLLGSVTNFPPTRMFSSPPVVAAADASAVAVGGFASPLRVIDLATGTTNWSIPAPQADFRQLLLAPGGSNLFAVQGARRSTIRIFDFRTGKELCAPLRIEDADGVGSPVLSPDGRTLVASGAGDLVVFWDVSDLSRGPRELVHLRSRFISDSLLALLPDSRTLLTCSREGRVLAWDASGPRQSRGPARVPIGDLVKRFRLSADGRALILAASDGTVSQRHGEAFQTETILFGIGRTLQQPYLSEDGLWYAAGSSNGMAEVWSIAERRRVAEIGNPGGVTIPVHLSKDGTKLIVRDRAGGRYAEWDLASRREIRSFPAPYPEERRLGIVSAWSSDGQRLLEGIRNGELTLLDVNTQEKQVRNLGLGVFSSLQLAPDGERCVATAGAFGTRVFNTRTLEPIANLEDENDSILSACFLDPGDRAVVGGWNGRGDQAFVAVRDIATQLELVRIETKGSAAQVGVSLDGNVLVAQIGKSWSSPDQAKEILVVRAPSWEEIERAEASLPSVSAVRP